MIDCSQTEISTISLQIFLYIIGVSNGLKKQSPLLIQLFWIRIPIDGFVRSPDNDAAVNIMKAGLYTSDDFQGR